MPSPGMQPVQKEQALGVMIPSMYCFSLLAQQELPYAV